MNDDILDFGIRNLSPGDEAKHKRLLAENIESKKRLRNGRIVLAILIGFICFAAWYVIKTINESPRFYLIEKKEIYIDFGINIAVYLGCLIYSFYNPKVAFIIAFIIFILSRIYNFYYGATIGGALGLFLHILVFTVLIKAIISAINIQRNNRIIATLGIEN